jgi:hypothetical protein
LLVALISSAFAAPTVTVEGACPGTGTIQVEGVTPGSTFATLLGRGPGGFVIAGGPCAGTTLDIDGVVRNERRAADASGAGAVMMAWPAAACSGVVQVLDMTTCALSSAISFGAPSGDTWTVDVGAPIGSSYPVLGMVRTADDGVAVAGGGGGNAWLVQVDPTGEVVSQTTYPMYSAAGLAATSDGGFLLVGEMTSYNDPTMIRVTDTGAVTWMSQIDHGYSEQGFYAAFEVPGGFRVAGIYDYGFTSAGDPTWAAITIGGGGNVNGMDLTLDGGTVSTGEGSYGSPADNYNTVVTKTNAGGATVWSRSMGGDGYDWSDDVVALADGGYAITGWTTSHGGSGSACWLGRLDSAGTLLWATHYPGFSTSACHEVLETSTGGFVLAGTFDSKAALLELDATGDVLWANSYGNGTAYAAVEVDTGWAFAKNDSGSLSVGRVDGVGASGCEAPLSVAAATLPFAQTSNSPYSSSVPARIPAAGSATSAAWVNTSECL